MNTKITRSVQFDAFDHSTGYPIGIFCTNPKSPELPIGIIRIIFEADSIESIVRIALTFRLNSHESTQTSQNLAENREILKKLCPWLEKNSAELLRRGEGINPDVISILVVVPRTDNFQPPLSFLIQLMQELLVCLNISDYHFWNSLVWKTREWVEVPIKNSDQMAWTSTQQYLQRANPFPTPV